MQVHVFLFLTFFVNVFPQTIALSLRYPKDTVKHVSINQEIDNIINDADLVIYGSFREEQSFPEILLKAMSFEKPIIAPDLSMIRKYVGILASFYVCCPL